jgi:deoxyribose-phosphate aldolase
MVALASPQKFVSHLELILARPEVTCAEIAALCAIARSMGVAAVCVNGARVAQARALLEDSAVKVSATVGFPLGAMAADAKRYEVEAAVDAGAQEIDAVVNHGWLKDNAAQLCVRELRDLVEAADERPVKAIIEPGLLTAEEILRALLLVQEAEVPCLGAATGFGPRVANLEDIQRLRAAAGNELIIKATVAPANRAAAEAMITAGAMRLGLMGRLGNEGGLTNAPWI